MPIRVAVAGALGRMGRSTSAAIAVQPDLELVGGLARHAPDASLGRLLGLDSCVAPLFEDVERLFDATAPEVLLDFSLAPASSTLARAAVARGISPVVGATGWSDAERADLAARCESAGVGALLVPNFALGAVLMMRFAEEAARWLPNVEIVELHHDGKRDKPSGTARLTAERIRRVTGGKEVPIHSVRLRGLVAHQEVLFGGDGELLTVRHDSLSRESFNAGVLLAIRRVRTLPGLVVGLDALLIGREGSGA